MGKIDARAAFLGLTRSAYLTIVATQDAALARPILSSQPQFQAAEIDLTREAYDFLLIAIPALEEYERLTKHNLPIPPTSEEIPPGTDNERLWRFFMIERNEILRLKWYESQKARQDIGLSRAIQIWLQRHRPLWAAAHRPEPEPPPQAASSDPEA